MATTARTQQHKNEKLSSNQRRHHRQEIQKRLKAIQVEIIQLTNRTPPLPARIQFYDDDTLTSPAFCGTYEKKEFRVASQLLNRPLLLETVLYREMYTILLPPVVKIVPESGDLGLLCAYQHANENDYEQLLKLWQVVSPRRGLGDVVDNAPF